MDEQALEAIFAAWWVDNYGLPPRSHAVMTHASFAAYVLELAKHVEPVE